MNKTVGNVILWSLLFALVSNGAINIPRSVAVVSDKLGRMLVILLTDTQD